MSQEERNRYKSISTIIIGGKPLTRSKEPFVNDNLPEYLKRLRELRERAKRARVLVKYQVPQPAY